MPHLSTIPRELRDEILTLVLLARRQAPQTALEAESQDRVSFSNVDPSGWRAHTCYYLAHPADYVPSALPLLLTSKQIHEETKQNLDRLPGNGRDYELDVMLVDERYLAPTWIHVPILVNNVHRVCATFQNTVVLRRAGKKSECYDCAKDIWRGGDASYLLMFYGLLERFLRVGPRRQTNIIDDKKLVTVDHLELNFVDPDEIDLIGVDFITIEGNRSRAGWWRPVDNDKREILSADSLARHLAKYIDFLVDMGYHFASYGGVLFERIGSIKFKVNGELLKEFDLGQILADLSFNDSFGNRPWNKRLNT